MLKLAPCVGSGLLVNSVMLYRSTEFYKAVTLDLSLGDEGTNEGVSRFSICQTEFTINPVEVTFSRQV